MALLQRFFLYRSVCGHHPAPPGGLRGQCHNQAVLLIEIDPLLETCPSRQFSGPKLQQGTAGCLIALSHLMRCLFWE